MKLRKPKMTTRALAILPATAILAAAPALALAAPTSYSMVVLEHAPEARNLMSGDYATTMEGIRNLEAVAYKSFDIHNNLCVGYTVTKAFDKAQAACDLAVELHADTARPYHGFMATGMALSKSNRKAVALTNRGVLKAVTGDTPGAAEDFTLAAESSNAVVESDANLAYLASKSAGPEAIAQAIR